VEDLQRRFRSYIDTSASAFAQDLAALLNRAKALGIAVCPDVDEEGSSYSIEWGYGGEWRALDVAWDGRADQWRVGDSDA
jgi:hypothetical protein